MPTAAVPPGSSTVDTVRRVLTRLAAGPSEQDRAAGRSSALGPDVRVTLLDLAGTRATIDIQPGQLPTGAGRLPLAIGQLVLTVGLDRKGNVKSVDVIQSSGHKVLDDAAIRMVRLAEPFPALPESEEQVDELYISRTWQFLPGDILRNR